MGPRRLFSDDLFWDSVLTNRVIGRFVEPDDFNGGWRSNRYHNTFPASR